MARRELVSKAIAERSGQIVAFARELIAVPTENPPGNAYPECVELLEDRLRSFGLPVELVRLSPDRVALIAGVGEGPTLFLHGHYDVVPASASGQFTPSLEGSRLRGRGSADMKGGIASMAFALVAVSGLRLGGRAELVLVPDEETGGEGGSRRLAELGRLGRNGIGAILGEPTSGRIWNASRGALTLRVTVRGRPAHVGLHYQGSNAFESALPILQALRGLKQEVERHRTSFRIAPEAATASILMLGGEVTGGHPFNVVPDRFSFSVERRFNPEEDLEAERLRMLAAIRDSTPAGVEAEIHVVQRGSSHAVGEDSALVRALGSAVEEVCGSPTRCELCPGLLETRFYADAGVPAVAYGPGELEVSHGPNESVAVERLTECAKVYALTALALLGGR
ncbi:MAG: ArgE/DapE family deacylase [Longimicrobiales bacterium]|nr:ArgE/DapE family deacylase [Longimicrobiales bacterium]